MSLYITCPRCHASLKANKLPSETKTVTCPECRQPFQVATTGVTAAVPYPRIAETASAPAESFTSIAAPAGNRWLAVGVIASILVVGAGIITAIVLTRTPTPEPGPTPPVVAAQEKEESPKLQSEKDGEQDKRRQEFIRLMIEGGTSHIGQRYDEALSAYTEAAKLFPEDADIKQKLAETQTAAAKQRQAKLDEQKVRDDAAQLAKKARAALEEKQYAAAVELFKLALQKDASLSDASQGLIDAQSALSREQVDKKKLAEYEQFILSGKAAMKAGRYADAIRDFVSAQRIWPDDATAMQFQREAEKQLDGLMNRAEKQKEYQRLIDQANAAVRAKSFEEAEKTFQRALRLFPNDAVALQGIEDAQNSLKLTRTEYAAWMLKGNAALQVGRFGEAALAFREASRLFPDDQLASRAVRQAELLQGNQDTYYRAMERAGTAMSFKQYGDAVVAYNEALRVAPNDVAALQGLRDAQRLFEADFQKRKDFEKKAFNGLQLLKAQRYSDAEAELRDAVRIMPHHPQVEVVRSQARYADAMGKGVSELNARRFNEAIGHFQAALREFPNDFAARNGLNRARAGNKGGKA